MPGQLGKVRSPWIVILLSIVTLGIYGIYWQYAMFKEMKDYSGQGIGGVLGLVLAIILSIVNIFVMPSEVGNLYAAEGQPKPVKGTDGLLDPASAHRRLRLAVQGAGPSQQVLVGARRRGGVGRRSRTHRRALLARKSPRDSVGANGLSAPMEVA